MQLFRDARITQNALTSVKSHAFMSGWKVMPFLHFIRIGSEVFFEDSTHWSLTDTCFCSHFCSRTTWIPSQLFPRIFHRSFSALAWSGACFTSFLELFNHLPNSFTANMQLLRDVRITLTFFYGVLRLYLYLQPLVKSFFINFYFCNVKYT